MYSTFLQPTGPQNTRWWNLTLLQRCCRCILHSFSRLVHRTLVGGILPFRRDAVGVFYIDLSPQNTRWGNLTLLQRCCRCILHSLSRLTHRTLVGEILPFCRDAVGVFYIPSADWSTEHSLGESYPFAEMLSVYSIFLQSTDPQNPRWGNLTLLQRCSRCILHSFSRLVHRTLVGGILPLLQRCCRCILYSFSRLTHRNLVGGILPFCSDAVGVFYSPPPAIQS